MALAMSLAVVWGAVSARYAPVSGFWFPIGGVASVVCMALAGFGRVGSVPTGGWPIAGPHLARGLAGLAALLMVTDTFRRVSMASVLPQLLLALLFLLSAIHLARHRAFLAASGSAGFSVTAVAMIVTNSWGGGWIGFAGTRMH